MSRGIKPQGKVKIEWSGDFAYALGLIVTDGSLSKNGRNINLTSKDLDQINNFLRALKISAHIGIKNSGPTKEKKYFVVQIGDVLFYKYLQSIGLMPNKTKVMGQIEVPDSYFFDFLRGHFDGDGSTYSYWDPRWKSSFMFYLAFCSASEKHIDWLRSKIKFFLGVNGHLSKAKKSSCYQLKYAKKESLKIFKKMYREKDSINLARKRLKIKEMLATIGEKI